MRKGYARGATISAATLAAVMAGGSMSPALAGVSPVQPTSVPSGFPVPLLPSLTGVPLPGTPSSPPSPPLPGGGTSPGGNIGGRVGHPAAHPAGSTGRHHHRGGGHHTGSAAPHRKTPVAPTVTSVPLLTAPMYNAQLNAALRADDRAPLLSPAPAAPPAHPVKPHPMAVHPASSTNPLAVLDRNLPVGVVLLAGVALLTVAGAHGMAWVRRVAWA